MFQMAMQNVSCSSDMGFLFVKMYSSSKQAAQRRSQAVQTLA